LKKKFKTCDRLDTVINIVVFFAKHSLDFDFAEIVNRHALSLVLVQVIANGPPVWVKLARAVNRNSDLDSDSDSCLYVNVA